jgi:hypothetical protein
MNLMSPEEYRDSLRELDPDVWVRGKRVESLGDSLYSSQESLTTHWYLHLLTYLTLLQKEDMLLETAAPVDQLLASAGA